MQGIVVTFERKYAINEEWTAENISQYIRVADYDCDEQRYPDEVVIPMNVIQVRYEYPLTYPVTIEFISDDAAGFTRATLIEMICDAYQDIYDEEDSDVGDPGYIDGTLNREQSSGRYGIWGHYITDLLLWEVRQVDDNVFTLGVDS